MNMKAFLSGAITGAIIAVIASAVGFPWLAAFACWLVGTVNGIIISGGKR